MRKLYQHIKRKRTTAVHAISFQSCELQSCLSHSLMLFRYIGVFPVEGLTSSNVGNIRFKLKSMYGVYYGLSLVGQIICFVLSVRWCYISNYTSTSAMLHVLIFFTTIIFIIILTIIAKNWQHVLKKIANIELNLKEIRKSKKCRRHCNVLLYGILASYVVETSIAFVFRTKVIEVCLGLKEAGEGKWHLILKCLLPQLFNYTSYTTWKFLIFAFLYIQASLLCSLIDTIVICISVYLISYFRGLNNKIKSHRTKSPQFWEKQRCHYTQLHKLVKIINGQLRVLIFTCFIAYLVFICIQVFFVINSKSLRFRDCDEKLLNKVTHSTENVLYIAFAALTPIVRALLTCLLAADVHIEAQKPMLYLHEVVDSTYNLDIQRFRLQILYCPIYLSGSLFCITRNTILKVVSKIITYELVLLQLNRSSRLHISAILEYDNTTDVK